LDPPDADASALPDVDEPLEPPDVEDPPDVDEPLGPVGVDEPPEPPSLDEGKRSLESAPPHAQTTKNATMTPATLRMALGARTRTRRRSFLRHSSTALNVPLRGEPRASRRGGNALFPLRPFSTATGSAAFLSFGVRRKGAACVRSQGVTARCH